MPLNLKNWMAHAFAIFYGTFFIYHTFLQSFACFRRGSYEEPQLSEGFQEIVKVNFVPYFKDKKEEKLYFSFLL